MKAKIFSKLKQEYSSLGLGDEILMGLADSLATTGLVTDENIDLVVSAQKANLENLQKQNDARVNAALAKQQKKLAEEAAAKKAEEEKLANEKAEAERKAAEDKERLEKEEKQKQAEKEAKEKEEAEKAALADEEAKRLQELEKAGVSQDILNLIKKQNEDAAKQRAEFEQRFKEFNTQHESLIATMTEQKNSYEASIKSLTDSNKALKQGYDSIVKEKEEAELVRKAAERIEFIASEARRLGIPDWRIDEGFVIGGESDNDAIAQTLSKIAENISTNMLPTNKNTFPIGSPQDLPKAELDSLAEQIISKVK